MGVGWSACPSSRSLVPQPLREDLPALLAPGSMRTPAIRILLLIFIRENTLERSPMQVEIYHIGRGERSLWQGGIEQQARHLASRGTDRSGSRSRRVRGDDDPCTVSAWSE